MIITKLISRFGRNTETVIKTVRMLKAINLDVYFESQKMHTLSEEGEFMLTVLASYYQEEARSVSENMKWRIKKDFEQGIAWGGNDNLADKLSLIETYDLILWNSMLDEAIANEDGTIQFKLKGRKQITL